MTSLAKCNHCKYLRHIDQLGMGGYGIVCLKAPYVHKTNHIQRTVGPMTAENALTFCRGKWFRPTLWRRFGVWLERVWPWR